MRTNGSAGINVKSTVVSIHHVFNHPFSDFAFSLYETIPVGLLAQPVFWNTTVLIETDLTPAQVNVNLLRPIEQRLKRQRHSDKNAPRTIDLNIVLFNDEVHEYNPGDGRIRTIPAPDLLKFAHVAVPVAEPAPNMPHPVTGKPLQAIADALLHQQMPHGRPAIFRREDVAL